MRVMRRGVGWRNFCADAGKGSVSVAQLIFYLLSLDLPPQIHSGLVPDLQPVPPVDPEGKKSLRTLE